MESELAVAIEEAADEPEISANRRWSKRSPPFPAETYTVGECVVVSVSAGASGPSRCLAAG